jgi:hypothetical protein
MTSAMEWGGRFRHVNRQDIVSRVLLYTSDGQWPRVSSVPGLRANQRHGKVSLSCIMQAPAKDEAVESCCSLADDSSAVFLRLLPPVGSWNNEYAAKGIYRSI